MSKLTTKKNGFLVWTDEAFDSEINRNALIYELRSLGFEFVNNNDGEFDSWNLYIHKTEEERTEAWRSCEPDFLNIHLDYNAKDGSKLSSFTKDYRVSLYFKGRESLYRLQDLWQAIRQEWSIMLNFSDYKKGKYKLEDHFNVVKPIATS